MIFHFHNAASSTKSKMRSLSSQIATSENVLSEPRPVIVKDSFQYFKDLALPPVLYISYKVEHTSRLNLVAKIRKNFNLHIINVKFFPIRVSFFAFLNIYGVRVHSVHCSLFTGDNKRKRWGYIIIFIYKNK